MYAKKDLMNTGRIVRIRDPIRPEDRKVIAEYIRFRKRILRNEGWIGGQDRSFDAASNTYGNSFTNFEEWPDDVPMDAQVSAEYFLFMCFKDLRIQPEVRRVRETAEEGHVSRPEV